MMPTPDVRVKLSAEGVQEVVDAFRKISAEAKTSGKSMSDSMALLTKFAGADVFLRAAGYLKEFATAAIETQHQIALLTEKTGMSAPVLSVLSRAAKLTNADLGDLGTACKFLNKNLDDLSFGNAKARDSFSRLGLSAKDFLGLNPDQKFLTVATALGNVADETERSRLATDLFGRGAQSMLPVMVELAQKGFKPMADDAARLHQLWDDKEVKQAEELTRRFTSMKLEAEGLAGSFLLMAENWLKWIAAKSDQAITAQGTQLQIPGAPPLTSGEPTPTSQHAPAAPIALATAHAVGQAEEYAKKLAQYQAEQRVEQLQRDSITSAARIAAAKQAAASMLAVEKGFISAQQLADDQAYAQGLTSISDYYAQRTDLVDRELGAELADLTQQRALQQQQNAQRLAGIDAEIAKAKAFNTYAAEGPDLEAKRAAAVIDGQTKIAAIDDKVAETVQAAERKRAELAGHRTEAERTEGLARLDLEKQIAEAQGDTYNAALKGIQKQGEELARTLHTTIDDPEIKAFLALLNSQAITDRFKRAFALGMGGLGAGTGNLDNLQQYLQGQVTGGAMFPAQAQKAYSDAIKQQLPMLQQQLDVQRAAAQAQMDAAQSALALAEATGTDTLAQREGVLAAQESINAVDAQQNRLNELGVAADFAKQQMGQLTQGLQEAMTQDLAGWLSSGIDQATSFGDAMRGLALSIVQSVRNLAAQLLAAMLIYKLFSKLMPQDQGKNAPQLMGASIMLMVGGSIVSKAAKDLQQASEQLMSAAVMLMIANSMGGGVVGKAGGGLIYGRGTDTSDNIPIWVSPGEYVVRARAVRALGVGTMDLINQGVHPPSMSRSRRFADGGLVEFQPGGGSAAGGSAGMTAVLDLNPELTLKRLEASPEFHRVIVRTAENHRRAINSALGRGAQ